MNERTPERIYHWRNSQLSVARFYGGCKFNGAHYSIAYGEEGEPLVRADVLACERKANMLQRRETAKREKERWMLAQDSLLPPNEQVKPTDCRERSERKEGRP